MFCKNCGAKLDDDALFCEKCGTIIKKPVSAETDSVEQPVTNDEDEQGRQNGEQVTEVREPVTEQPVPEKAEADKQLHKEKPRKSPVAAVIIAAVILIAAAGLFLMRPSENSANADPRVQANFNNGGQMAFDETRLYFVGNFDSDDKETCVYSISYDGGDKRVIAANDNIKKIRIVEDKILYSSREDSKSIIGSMDKDGSNNTKIVETDEWIWNFDIMSSKLYYLADGKIHCCTTDGNNDEIIAEDVDDFVLSGSCFYTNETGIYSYDPKRGESKKICGAEAKYLIHKDHKLYFKTEDGLYSVADDGSETEKLIISNGQVGHYTMDNNTIYFVQQFTEDEVEQLAEYFYDGKDNTSKYAYKLLFTGSGVVRSCPVSGGSSTELETDPPVISSIFTYPQGMYGSISDLSDTFNELVIK